MSASVQGPQSPSPRPPDRAGSSARPTRSPRDRLLSAATRLFYRHGINAVGVETIFAEAGAARMTLYRHFGSKEQLIVSCLERLDAKYHNWFVEQVESRADNPATRLLCAFDVLDEWINSEDFRGCAFMNASVELAKPDHPAHAAVRSHKARDRQYLTDLARAAGLTKPEACGRRLMLLMEGAIITALVQGDTSAAADAKETAAALLAMS